ncbi:MAG: HD domain-containing protein [Flavobacteriales bacterium]|nr:HD domain-containing protein [Flavobacteriales bacterium]
MNRLEEISSRILARLEKDLAPTLYYHGLYHTKDVVGATKEICTAEGVSGTDLELLLVAAAFHDCGHLVAYTNHEEASCGIAYFMMYEAGYTMEEIQIVCGMIMATKVPQKPKNKLEQIICDADLDYLGRTDYDKISGYLYKEFCAWDVLCGERNWIERQISFLNVHQYWTDFSKENRQSGKREQIALLDKKLAQLED